MKRGVKMSENQENEAIIYAVTYKNIIVITIYYVLLFLIAIAVFAGTIFVEYTSCLPIKSMPLAIIGCSATSLLGSVIYYIRKIYRASIHDKIKPKDEINSIQKWGTMLYFFIRPIFAMIITVIIVLGLSVGVFAFFITGGTLSETFVNFTMVIAFFLGFSNGILVDKLSKIGNNFIAKIVD